MVDVRKILVEILEDRGNKDFNGSDIKHVVDCIMTIDGGESRVGKQIPAKELVAEWLHGGSES